jgi:multidrug resistance efflux pump
VPVAPLLAPEPPEPAEPAVSTQALDLATRAIEARGECRLCAGDLARVHQLAEEGQAPRHEVQRAKIRLEVAEQKLDVVMRALQAEEGALQREIARVRRDRSLKRDERERAQARIEGNLEILRSAR